MGLKASIAGLDIPIKNPKGIATNAPKPNPKITRRKLANNNQPIPKSPGPLS